MVDYVDRRLSDVHYVAPQVAGTPAGADAAGATPPEAAAHL